MGIVDWSIFIHKIYTCWKFYVQIGSSFGTKSYLSIWGMRSERKQQKVLTCNSFWTVLLRANENWNFSLSNFRINFSHSTSTQYLNVFHLNVFSSCHLDDDHVPDHDHDYDHDLDDVHVHDLCHVCWKKIKQKGL